LRPVVLDRLNENNFLGAIAGCGGLVSAQQFEVMMGRSQSGACRAYHALAEASMAYLLRAARNSCFILLSKRTVEALGSEHPTPPQPKAVRMTTYQLAVARAEYFIKFGHIPRPTSDLCSAKHKGARTLRLVARAIDANLKAIKAQGRRLTAQYQAAPSEELKTKMKLLQRQLRAPAIILKAGAAALRHRRGLFLLQPKGPHLTFVFVDRVTQARTYAELVSMLGTFAAATSVPTHLDILCGSARSKQRVDVHFKKPESRIRIRVLDLNYDRYMGAGLDLPTLVSSHEINRLLVAGEGEAQ
jgi:hypothetical protein